MGVSRLGTVVVLTALLLSCRVREEPLAANSAAASEPAPVAVTEPETVANPFGLARVDGFDDNEVRFYAALVELAGDSEDENASQWSDVGTAGFHDSIDGEWASRWNADPPNDAWHLGTARIKTVGDRVFIHFQGEYEYSVETVRQDDRLVGRYVAVSDETVTLPWVGFIVSNERIDGIWPFGRWDFRRGGQATSEESAP
jgi:hypothetical protein